MIAELKIDELLSEVINTTCIDRALLCKLHNGGAQIMVGSEKRLSVIIEPENSLEPRTKKQYQNFEVDKPYIEIMLAMLEDRRFAYNETKDLSPSALERKAKADGLTAILHANGKPSSTGLYFFFLATTGEASVLLGDYKDHAKLETFISRLRSELANAIRKKLLK